MRYTTKAFCTILLFFTITVSYSQDRSYNIFNQDGKKVSYKKMVKQLAKTDVVFFGEIHDNAIAHWLELELTESLDEKRDLILGAEMMEADNQDVLNQYLSGEINQEELDSLARLWINYKSDYAPLIDYAKENQLAVIATNIPRRIANQVYKGDFQALDSLSAEELTWVAPLPIAFDPDLPGYQRILTTLGEHGSPNLVKAQAIKDATMAHFILENMEEDKLFLHFNGSWHSDFYEGIVWYIKQSNDELAMKTISVVTQSQVESLDAEHINRADFVICVDEQIPGTY